MKWQANLHTEVSDIKARANLLLVSCKAAWEQHKQTDMCTLKEGGSVCRDCCGCHFWQGATEALKDLLT